MRPKEGETMYQRLTKERKRVLDSWLLHILQLLKVYVMNPIQELKDLGKMQVKQFFF